MPHGVRGIGDGTRGLAEFAEHRIATIEPEPASHVLLVLRTQDIGRSSSLLQRAIVQGIAYVE